MFNSPRKRAIRALMTPIAPRVTEEVSIHPINTRIEGESEAGWYRYRASLKDGRVPYHVTEPTLWCTLKTVISRLWSRV